MSSPAYLSFASAIFSLAWLSLCIGRLGADVDINGAYDAWEIKIDGLSGLPMSSWLIPFERALSV
jgi:hypothetical protein